MILLHKYILILAAGLSFCFVLDARPLPDSHFLFPRDVQALQLTAITPLGSARRIQQALESCPTTQPPTTMTAQVCRHANGLLESNPPDMQHHNFWSSDTDLLFIGERHTDSEGQVFLAETLPLLHSKGFDTLALEMFNSSDQKYLDKYRRGDIQIEDLEEVLAATWNYELDSYLQLIEQAKELDMEILGIDDRKNAAGLPMSQNLIQRDQHMGGILSRHFQDHPNSRIVALTGRLHAFQVLSQTQKVKSVAEIVLTERPLLKSESFFLLGRQDPSSFATILNGLFAEPQGRSYHSPTFAPYIQGFIRP